MVAEKQSLRLAREWREHVKTAEEVHRCMSMAEDDGVNIAVHGVKKHQLKVLWNAVEEEYLGEEHKRDKDDLKRFMKLLTSSMLEDERHQVEELIKKWDALKNNLVKKRARQECQGEGLYEYGFEEGRVVRGEVGELDG